MFSLRIPQMHADILNSSSIGIATRPYRTIRSNVSILSVRVFSISISIPRRKNIDIVICPRKRELQQVLRTSVRNELINNWSLTLFRIRRWRVATRLNRTILIHNSIPNSSVFFVARMGEMSRFGFFQNKHVRATWKKENIRILGIICRKTKICKDFIGNAYVITWFMNIVNIFIVNFFLMQVYIKGLNENR